MKILFFVGPQKTGTSDLYKNFYEKNDRLLIPNGWIYPSCGRTLGPQTRAVDCWAKPFSNLVNAFAGRNLSWCGCDGLDTAEKLLGHYRNYFFDQMSKNRNIVFGTEYFTGQFGIRKTREKYVDGLRSLLPWDGDAFVGDGNEFRCVVSFRTPRLRSLLSLFRHATFSDPFVKNRRNSDGFFDYLTKIFQTRNGEQPNISCNPLGYASQLLELDVPVTVIDMGGADTDGLDISDVAFCELVGTPCIDGKHANSPQKSQLNKSKVKLYASETILEVVEDLLVTMDCSYREALENDPQFQLLHEGSMFLRCEEMNQKHGRALTPSEVYSYIEEIGKLRRLPQSYSQLLSSRAGDKNKEIIPQSDSITISNRDSSTHDKFKTYYNYMEDLRLNFLIFVCALMFMLRPFVRKRLRQK